MLLAVAALMFQFQAVSGALPSDGAKDARPEHSASLAPATFAPTPTIEKASVESNSRLDVSSVRLSENSRSGVINSEEAENSTNTNQNGESLSTIHLPDPGVARQGRFEAPERLPSRRAWLTLAVAEHSAAVFDAYSTNHAVSYGAVEKDPLIRPFAGSPSVYVATQVGPFLFDFIARRMQRSENGYVRRMWWAPQSVSFATSILAGVHNLRVANELAK